MHSNTAKQQVEGTCGSAVPPRLSVVYCMMYCLAYWVSMQEGGHVTCRLRQRIAGCGSAGLFSPSVVVPDK